MTIRIRSADFCCYVLKGQGRIHRQALIRSFTGLDSNTSKVERAREMKVSLSMEDFTGSLRTRIEEDNSV